MCGIFGFISTQPTRVDWEYLGRLGSLNEQRGSQACGLLIASPVTYQIYRSLEQPVTSLLRSVEDHSPTQLISILGHSKAPTTGRLSPETVQPVASEDRQMFLGHNGSILNWQSIDMVAQFDTKAILTAIRLPEESLLKQGLERLDGQHACWLYLVPTKSIYLWRVMSPLFVSFHGSCLWFSSVVPEEERDEWALLDEGAVYRAVGGELQVRCRFDYRSIY